MSLVQSGWLVTSVTASTDLNGPAGYYWLVLCDSQNAHIGRDGTVRGAKIYLQNYAAISGLGFVVLRLVSGTIYAVVGKSEEITTGLANGLNTLTFTSPIKGCLSTDLLAVAYKCDGAYVIYAYASGDTTATPILDQATGKLRWYNPGSEATYAGLLTVGSSYNCNGGGSAFNLVRMCPLMDPAIVQVVGDSIAEGSPLNRSYRNNSTAKSRLGAFAYRLCRDFWGTLTEISGNVEGSATAANVLATDLTSALWAKAPRVLFLHVGVNDINEGQTWAQYSANLDSILAACVTNHATLVLTDIFPWTGNSANTTGTHAQNTLRDTWNVSLATWASANGVRLISARTALGQERTVAKSGDPTPTAGNLWDLQTAYDAADGLGVHLSAAGCTAAGVEFAKQLGCFEFYSSPTAQDLYAVFRCPYTRRYWYLNAWEDYSAAHWADYVWPLTEDQLLHYATLFPPGITQPGAYYVEIYTRAAAVPATTDVLKERVKYLSNGYGYESPSRVDNDGNVLAVDSSGNTIATESSVSAYANVAS